MNFQSILIFLYKLFFIIKFNYNLHFIKLYIDYWINKFKYKQIKKNYKYIIHLYIFLKLKKISSSTIIYIIERKRDFSSHFNKSICKKYLMIRIFFRKTFICKWWISFITLNFNFFKNITQCLQIFVIANIKAILFYL